jgi:hypothetical protein
MGKLDDDFSKANDWRCRYDEQIAAFIRKWAKSGGAERANYQLFLTELCDVLGVEHPEPTGPDDHENKYVFEKNVVFDNGDGSRSTRRIDLYRRGAFICETKQGVEKQDAETPLSERAIEASKKRKAGHGKRGTKAYDDTMLRARPTMRFAFRLQRGQGLIA